MACPRERLEDGLTRLKKGIEFYKKFVKVEGTNLSKVYLIKNSESDYNQLGKNALELLEKMVPETGHWFKKEAP